APGRSPGRGLFAGFTPLALGGRGVLRTEYGVRSTSCPSAERGAYRTSKAVTAAAAGPALLQHAVQVRAVVALAARLGQALELPGVDEALQQRHLLDAGDLQPLPLFERLHELPRGQQRIGRARVQPRDPAPQRRDRQPAGLEVLQVHVGD